MQTKIQTRLTQAMRDKDKPLVAVLRDIKSNFINKAIEVKGPLNDFQAIKALDSMAKKRQQTIDACGDKSDYTDMKKQEQYELSIIGEYLPEKMDQDQIRSAINDIIQKSDFGHGPQNLGKVMKEFTSQYKSENGKLVSSIARDILSA